MKKKKTGNGKSQVPMVKEFGNNPLIRKLEPPPIDENEAIERLMVKPDFDPSERLLPASVRTSLPGRLRRFFNPTLQHVGIAQYIISQIHDGYRLRNPVTADGQRQLYSGGTLFTNANRTSSISFITGLSGMGKSVLIRAILKTLGGPVIKHESFEGKPFAETQIVFLMRNVPDQCSAKSICKTLIEETDRLLGQDLYYPKYIGGHRTRTDYVMALRRVLANHHVGLLVIDEFQNLSLAQSGGREELIAFILNLREELGVPVVLVGTYKAAGLLMNDAAVARRLADGGFHALKRPERPDDPIWRDFCETTWEYQWVQKPAKLTDEIIDFLYKCSQGIPGIMLSLFIAAQIEAINSGTEKVNKMMLRLAYDEQLRPLHGVIDAIRSGDRGKMDYYDDLYIRDMPMIDIDAVPPTSLSEAKQRQENPSNECPAALISDRGEMHPSGDIQAVVSNGQRVRNRSARLKKKSPKKLMKEIQKRSTKIPI